MCDRLCAIGSSQYTREGNRLPSLASSPQVPTTTHTNIRTQGLAQMSSKSSSFQGLFPKKRPRSAAAVETVVASTGFPVSGHNKRPRDNSTKLAVQAAAAPSQYNKKNKKPKLLDCHETAREIKTLAATGFTKQQKRSYEDEEYKRLTGRERKKQKVPLKIALGLKRKAAEREAAAAAEARAAGMVLPKQTTKAKKISKGSQDPRNHGPAPSIGFVKKGVLQLKKKPV